MNVEPHSTREGLMVARPCLWCRIGLSFVGLFSFTCRCDHQHRWVYDGLFSEGDNYNGGEAWRGYHCETCKVRRDAFSPWFEGRMPVWEMEATGR